MLGTHLVPSPTLPPGKLLYGGLASCSPFLVSEGQGWHQHVPLIPTISTLHRESVSSAIGAIKMIPALYFTDRKRELVLGMWGIFNH